MADLLATSPFVNPGSGYQHRRITLSVIRREDGTPSEFVVQRQCVDETGRVTQQDGNWLPVFNNDPGEIQERAWERFVERSSEDLRYPLSNLQSERFANLRDSLTIETGKG